MAYEVLQENNYNYLVVIVFLCMLMLNSWRHNFWYILCKIDNFYQMAVRRALGLYTSRRQS